MFEKDNTVLSFVKGNLSVKFPYTGLSEVYKYLADFSLATHQAFHAKTVSRD